MDSLILYHGTTKKFETPDWDKLNGDINGMLYGKAMYLCLAAIEAEVWAEEEGHVYEYEINLQGLKVLKIDQHGEEMYRALVSMIITDDCEYDVVIIPNCCILGYDDALFEAIIMGEGTEEEIQRMCKIAKAGEYTQESGEVVQFDISEPVLDVLVRSEIALGRLKMRG